MDKKETKTIFSKMRKMFGNWYKRSPFYKQSGYSDLEAKRRRLITRRSIAEFTKHLWNEAPFERRMERLLRKQSRKGKIERVQKREEKANKRNARLARFCGTKTHRELVSVWQQWEKTAYLGLRHPELKKEGVSLEYYLGFQNGLLSNIEANRKLFDDAKVAVYKAEQKKEEEAKEEK